METTVSPEQLREIFLTTQDSESTRVMAILLSLSLCGVILWLVRRRSLQEEYTPIWMFVGFLMLVLTAAPGLLEYVTRAIGAWTTSSTLFFLGEFFLVAICLNYAVRLSRASLRLKNLAQEVALLKAQVDRLSNQAPRTGEGT
jgi:hypothetical protein